MTNLTLIIPAKNESESLPQVIDELKKYQYKIDVIVHETDKSTIDSIKNLNIEIKYQKSQGYGDALIYGIENCQTEYFCIFNADGSFKPSEIDFMMEKLKSENIDFVFGSRYQKNSGSEDDTIITLIGNYIFTFLGKILFKLPPQSIFKNPASVTTRFNSTPLTFTLSNNYKSSIFKFCNRL